jgi:hypothetical protein
MITSCRITDHLTLAASFISRQPVAPLIVRCRSRLLAPPGIIVDVEHRFVKLKWDGGGTSY